MLHLRGFVDFLLFLLLFLLLFSCASFSSSPAVSSSLPSASSSSFCLFRSCAAYVVQFALSSSTNMNCRRSRRLMSDLESFLQSGNLAANVSFCAVCWHSWMFLTCLYFLFGFGVVSLRCWHVFLLTGSGGVCICCSCTSPCFYLVGYSSVISASCFRSVRAMSSSGGIRWIVALACEIADDVLSCANPFCRLAVLLLLPARAFLSAASSSMMFVSLLSVSIWCVLFPIFCSFPSICCISGKSCSCVVLVICVCVSIVITCVLFSQ